MRKYRSVWRGIRAMRPNSEKHQPFSRIVFCGLRYWVFYTIWWTPSWHEGRGPYVSIGLGPFAIYRGY